MANALYYGDNLSVMREHIKDESVDLVYLDPPFNSNADYNVLFRAPDGRESPAQIEAFADTWHWNETAERAFDETVKSGNTDAADLLVAMLKFLGRNDMMAYLAMMAVRLIELHRVLKRTGSLYLHCDPTASHYLKILLDAVFWKENFRNEITWKRTSAHSDGGRYGKNTDTILFYSKSDHWIWNQQCVEYEDKYRKRFRFSDPDGRLWMDDNATAKGLSGGGYEYEYKSAKSLWRYPLETMKRLDAEGRLHFTRTGGIRLKRYLDEAKGIPLQALWDGIPPINSQAQERLGYPTQKPVALLERIIGASSNEGDVVLDPFCGCGTSVHAAQKLGRRWIGIDVTHLAISLIEKRLKDAFPGVAYEVHGVPKDVDGAADLARRDKYQFQWWAVSLVDAVPFAGKKKGADGGIDGIVYFKPDPKTTERAIVSVKGGESVSVAMIRDLKGVLDRENAPIGIFVTLTAPTKPMVAEAAAAGFYDTGFGTFPRLQILTVKDLFAGKKPQIPFGHSEGFKKAPRERKGDQDKLL